MLELNSMITHKHRDVSTIPNRINHCQLNSHIFFDSEKQVPVKSLQIEKSVFPALNKVLGHDMINFKIITRIA